MNTRKTAIITGILFIVATAASLAGSAMRGPILNAPDYLTRMSVNGTPFIIGTLLAFLAAAASVGIAISLYPTLKNYGAGLALGAVCFRLMEAVFYIVGVLCLLALFPLSTSSIGAGAQNAYTLTMGGVLLTADDLAGFVFGVMAFCVGALCYYWIFYQTRLVPRWLSVWGIVAILLLFAATLLTLFDGEPFSISGNLILLALPIALQEMVLAVWLIVKGFNPAVLPSESAPVERARYQLAPQS